MNKVATSVLLLALAAQTQRVFGMENEDQVLFPALVEEGLPGSQNPCPAVLSPSLIVEELLVSQEPSIAEPVLAEPSTQQISQAKRSKAVKKLAVLLANPETSLIDIVKSEDRNTLQMHYQDFAFAHNSRKSKKAKKNVSYLLSGFGEDLNADEQLYRIIEQFSDAIWNACKPVYENSKHKTDQVIPCLLEQHKSIQTSHEQAKAEKIMHETTIKELEKQLNDEQKALGKTIKKERKLQKKDHEYTAAIATQNNRKKQNEQFFFYIKDQIKAKIAALDEEINDFDKELEQLVFQRESSYKKDKENLEERKSDALNQKKKLVAELDKINYYLPKINEPGSTSRQLYTVAANYNPLNLLWGSK